MIVQTSSSRLELPAANGASEGQTVEIYVRPNLMNLSPRNGEMNSLKGEVVGVTREVTASSSTSRSRDRGSRFHTTPKVSGFPGSGRMSRWGSRPTPASFISSESCERGRWNREVCRAPAHQAG